jgi:hypothetical protein
MAIGQWLLLFHKPFEHFAFYLLRKVPAAQECDARKVARRYADGTIKNINHNYLFA